MLPLAFTWPRVAVFVAVAAWAMAPEFRIIREASRAQRALPRAERDRSLRVLLDGQRLAMFIAVLLAFRAPGWSMPRPDIFFVVGLGVLVIASLLRRHCFRMLGADFRGDVVVRDDQEICDRGAYRYVRHPSYVAAMLLHVGIAFTLANWATLLAVLLLAPPLFVYRIRVEERALAARAGARYTEYMQRTDRLIPHVW